MALVALVSFIHISLLREQKMKMIAVCKLPGWYNFGKPTIEL
jgi:hypothetical protein